MNLTRPFDKSTLTQPFGGNQINYKDIAGTIGHPGQDYLVPYGTPIPVAIDGSYCYATLSKNNPNLMAYRAVCTLYEDSSGVYEIIYGHCSKITALPGKTYWEPDTLATVGNTGDVYHNGKEVTEAQKRAGSREGQHLHFQVRAVVKEPATSPTEAGAHYLNDGNGLLTYNGYKYKWKYPDNGYNSCIDPEPFFQAFIPPVVAPEPNDIEAEVQVYQQSVDPSVRAALLALIISQIKRFLHIT